MSKVKKFLYGFKLGAYLLGSLIGAVALCMFVFWILALIFKSGPVAAVVCMFLAFCVFMGFVSMDDDNEDGW